MAADVVRDGAEPAAGREAERGRGRSRETPTRLAIPTPRLIDARKIAALGSDIVQRTRRLEFGAVVAAIAVVILGVGAIAGGVLDPDESQHLHTAWLVSQGRVPYADFWEHHTPLLHYALAPVTRWFADRPVVYFAGRAIMGLAAAGTLALVAVLGRRLGPGVGPAAAILLAVELRFIQHGTQVRPDGPALLTWLLAVLVLVRWREREAAGRLLAAGFWLGTTAALTPKAAFLGLGAAAVVLAAQWKSPARLARALGWLAAGTAVPVAALLGWLALSGGAPALRGFWQDVVVDNLAFPDFVKQAPIGAEGAGFAMLAVAGIAMAVRSHGWAVLRHPVHGPLLIPAIVTSAILAWPATPAVYAYSWLPVVAVASIYAGRAFVPAVLESGVQRSALAALIVLAAIGVPAVVAGVFATSHRRDNSAEFARMERVLAYACPGEAIVDSRPLAVFRPTAFRYASLVLGVRIWIARGVIPAEALVSDLRGARAPVGILDGRLRKLGDPIASFIARHYAEEPDGLLLAGARLSLTAATGATDVDLLVPGVHRVVMSPGVRATIDGAEAVSPRMGLSAGRHRIAWSGGPGSLQVLIEPCAERRS